MCDIVDICSLPNHKNIIYKVTGNGLVFYVKSERGGAVIDLSKNFNICNYRVVISKDGFTYIKSPNPKNVTEKPKYTPELLSCNYSKFWLNWVNGIISLGKAGDPEPITTCRYNNNTEKICYIKFSSKNRVEWKVLLPPVLQGPCMRSLSVGEPQWVSAENQLPDGSLIGGYENEFLYIIRSKHNGSLSPGKFVPSLGVGYIPWGGEAHEKNEFQVLCGIDCKWVPNEGEIPVTAVEAGFSENHISEILYVGRAKHEGHVIPGKVQPSHAACFIAYNGREIAMRQYEILICPSHNKHSDQKVFFTRDESDDDPIYDSDDVD